MSIKRSAKDYFTFTKKEKRAVLILSAIIVLLSITPQLYLFIHSEDKVDDKVFEAGVKRYYAGQLKSLPEDEKATDELIQNDFAFAAKTDSYLSGKKIAHLFSFDPNTANEKDFTKLGLETRTIKSIINYRNKGGHFKSPEDFKKIYTLSEEEYNRLKSFIVIENSASMEKTKEQKSFASLHPKIIDVNSADSIEWGKLPGIGPYLTSKILKYKNSLGGFSSINQIGEVYGMKPETFELIKEKIKCDEKSISLIKKINLNSATKDELNAHPYINFRQATIIVNFRAQHGAFTNFDDLQNTDCFSSQEFNKIKPYISVN